MSVWWQHQQQKRIAKSRYRRNAKVDREDFNAMQVDYLGHSVPCFSSINRGLVEITD